MDIYLQFDLSFLDQQHFLQLQNHHPGIDSFEALLIPAQKNYFVAKKVSIESSIASNQVVWWTGATEPVTREVNE